MKKILSYIFTPIYYLVFAVLILAFHPIQIVCRNVWGYEAHKKSVDILNLLLLTNLKILGAKIIKEGSFDLPHDRPLIIVANHQNSFDIPPIIWFFRKSHPKFVSKIELAKNIPSISYNLRHSGAALINRKKFSQSIKEIIKLGNLIEKKNYAACIFPEGTRTKDGKIKKFKAGGLKALISAAPSALIVPFAIDGDYKLRRYGFFPLSFGETLKYAALKPIEPNGLSSDEVMHKIENVFNKRIVAN